MATQQIKDEQHFLSYLHNVLRENSKQRMTPDFCLLLEQLQGVPGVYSFWSEDDTPLYVGRSINLTSRMIDSYQNRFRNYKKRLYCRVIVCETASDAVVLESYYITKLKPALNRDGKYQDVLSLLVCGWPSFGPAVMCSDPKRPVVAITPKQALKSIHSHAKDHGDRYTSFRVQRFLDWAAANGDTWIILNQYTPISHLNHQRIKEGS